LTKTSYYLQRVAVAEGEAVANAEGREAVASADGAAAKGEVAAEDVVAEAYGLEPA